MRKKIIVIILTVISAVYFTQNKLSGEKLSDFNSPPNVSQLEPITKEDRILILAPHPDDEALGVGGIVQKAVKVGADVRIVYLTNGDHNQLAFIVYEKRIVIKKQAIIGMGEIRRKEAIAAMKLLGVPEENLIFLGYPDFGTLLIFLRYWGDVKPFRNMLTKTSTVPYKDALTPNAPYRGEAILWNIESILRRYKPTIVFVTNGVDTNGDHKAFYLFLQVALWDLRGQIPEPKVYPYIIHCYGWPKPRNYHPEFYINIPTLLKNSQIEWKSSDLTEEEVEKKYQAICLYKSQCADSAFYLKAFAKRNELFGGYQAIELNKAQSLLQQKQASDEFEIVTAFQNKTVTYGVAGDNLFINIFFKREASKGHSFYVNLVSYNHDIEFAQMPKVKINVSGDAIKVLDRGKFIKSENVRLNQKKHSVIIKIPLKILGDPEYILASVNTYTANFPSDLNAWRAIKIK